MEIGDLDVWTVTALAGEAIVARVGELVSGSGLTPQVRIYSPTGGNVGIGFSIPVNMAKRIYTELAAKGKVTRGWLGVSIQPLTPGPRAATRPDASRPGKGEADGGGA